MEEDGRRWTKQKVRKNQKMTKMFCLESAGDGLGTLVGVQIAQNIFWALGYDFFVDFFFSESHGNLTNRFVLILLRFLQHF